MALDFPNSPSIGQLYPQPPVANQPVYNWDGEKWTTIGGALGGKQNVYTDGSQPMIGQLVVVDPPVGGTSAASKNYVDTGVANVLKNTPQVFTPAQQQITRQNIYAAPFDAMMNNNIIINGSFEVNQLGIINVATGAGLLYFCDNWMLHSNVGNGLAATGLQVVNFPNYFPGFPCYGAVTVTTGQATLTSNDGCGVYGRLEGWRMARLAWGTANAQPVTFGFWTSHHRPGLYCLSLRGVGTSISYVATYTQAAADVPQYNVLTIPGCTTGSWPIDSLAELSITFGLGYGPTLQTPTANAWTAGNFAWFTGAVNGCAANTDVFRLGGVTIFPGSEAPSAARSPFIMRPYDTELVLCQRQLQKFSQILLSGYNAAGGYVFHETWFPTMRIAPAVTFITPTYNNMSALTNNQKFPNHVENYAAIVATGSGYAFYDMTLDARL